MLTLETKRDGPQSCEPGGADHTELLDRLRAAIVTGLKTERADIGTISAELSMSSRTLQRRLGRLGLSYREIMKAIRLELALYLLKDPALTVTQIAMELGYGDHAAFTRAFRNCTRQSPSKFRRAAAPNRLHR